MKQLVLIILLVASFIGHAQEKNGDDVMSEITDITANMQADQLLGIESDKERLEFRNSMKIMFDSPCYGNCKNGYGIYDYSDNIQYDGYWKNGERHGKGILYEYKNGKIYKAKGDFYNDQLNGKVVIYENGEVIFTGQFRNGKPVKNAELVNSGNFINGFAKVYQEKKVRYTNPGNTKVGIEMAGGVIDENGTIVVPLKYQFLDIIPEARLAFGSEYKCSGCISSKMQVITYDGYYSPYVYKDIKLKGYSEGLVGIQNLKGKWGFVNANGVEVIPCKYDSVGIFNNGKVQVKKGRKMYYIDKKGKKTK